MDERIRDTEAQIIETLEDDLGVRITEVNIKEYVRGDPTEEDATVTGAEINVQAYVSLDEPDDNGTDRFRYEP